ncbi:ABC transporter D family member 2, chloroplastic [Porphyridium purpureum]|uniref:Probable ATP-dependent transporter ycf16 n=1 Tax=Porphyridium purpureum TaxID=35688 RepID=A0A5J4YTQ8_PORPP|nr:ABC transporter D family member 2, chloroplastic [Porphyridium purpureum]|eukprot:POR1279..scf227_4
MKDEESHSSGSEDETRAREHERLAALPPLLASPGTAGTGLRTGSRSNADDEVKHQKLSRLWYLSIRLATPYWRNSTRGKYLLLLVVLLNLAKSGFIVAFSYAGRDFWTAISNRQETLFYAKALQIFVLICVAVPFFVLYIYARDVLVMEWRRYITSQLLQEYFHAQAFYQMESTAGPSKVDNPDQRICDDVRSFVEIASDLFFTLMSSVVDFCSFSWVLTSIAPKLYAGLIAYAFAGTVISWFVGRKLIHLNFVQLQREADFRYGLVRVRENAESIAFYGGNVREKMALDQRFASALENFLDVLRWTRNLNFWIFFYSNNIQIVPVLLVAPIYFAGTIELGSLNQALGAFNHVLDSLSLIINNFKRLSAFSASVDRLGDMVEFLENPARTVGAVGADRVGPRVFLKDQDIAALKMGSDDVAEPEHIVREESALAAAPLRIDSLTLKTPDDSARFLVHQLSLELALNQKMMIVGPSGSGKSSLLRALAGLWNAGSGRVFILPRASVMFLPQKPFCTLGTLRDQMIYPRHVDELTIEEQFSLAGDAALANTLEQVGLAGLAEKLGGFEASRDWSDVLSTGEQQRLAFARLLMRAQSGLTSFAILDEATSALDSASEELVYSLLQRQPNLFYISVGHRVSLAQYHNVLLRLLNDGAGSWEFESITEEKKAQAAAVSRFQL